MHCLLFDLLRNILRNYPEGNDTFTNKSGFKHGQSDQTKHVNTIQSLVSAKLNTTKKKNPKDRKETL